MMRPLGRPDAPAAAPPGGTAGAAAHHPAALASRSQRRGMLLLLVSVFLFTLMDASGKALTLRGYHPGQIVFCRMAVNLVVVAAVLAPRMPQVLRTRAPLLQIGRGLTQLGSIALFFTALQFIGLAEATAIMDINPVLITLGAAVFLGEKVGIRRALGIGAALVGAMVIIRPGAGVFQPAAVLPLIGAFSYAGGAILTRMVRNEPTATSILWATSVATLVSGMVAPLVWQPVQAGDLWLFIGMGLIGTVAQALLITAFSVAEAAAIAPFGYTGLIWAGLWGWLFFGNTPDGWTLTGAAIIVGAGLYVWSREAGHLARSR